MNKNLTKFWRKFPSKKKFNLSSREKKIDLNYIFPSGRQAITYILETNNLKRNNKIAIPEWSSNCLINAVGKICQPILIKDVLKYKINVDGIIFYDQWGWSNINRYQKKLLKKFKKEILIHDRVDSVDLNIKKKNNNKKIYKVFSLSKTIGLEGGGLILKNNNFLKSNVDKSHSKLSLKTDNLIKNNQKNSSELQDFRKNYIKMISKNDTVWINKNNIYSAFADEFKKRKYNLNIFFVSSLAENYPLWMKNNIKELITPNCIPIFKNKSLKFLQKKRIYLLKKYKLDSKIYHFDWNGNFFSPNYKRSLIMPIHSEVKNFKKIILDNRLWKN